MRRRLLGAAAGAALLASVVATGTASAAQPATWTIDPGGPFTGSAGVTLLTIQETGVQLTCSSAAASGTLKSGAGVENPLGELPAGSVLFNDCTGPVGLTFTVDHIGTWLLNGSSYDAATGVTTGTLVDIEALITGPGCDATVTGTVDITFTNSTEELKVLPNPTLTISRVDPVNDCLQLISQGQHAIFDGTFAVSPGQEITSP